MHIIIAMIMIVSASSAMADSSHCKELDGAHQQRYNPTELSEYQKCWLDVHKDENAGTIGDIFWVRVDDQYASMPVKQLRNAGSKKAAQVIVKEIITEVLVEREVIKWRGVTDEVHNTLIAERDQLLISLAEANEDLAYKAAQLAMVQRDIQTLQDITDEQLSEMVHGNEAQIAREIYAITNNTNFDSVIALEFPGVAILTFTLSRADSNTAANNLFSVFESSMIEATQRAIEIAYDQGYRDGYQDGYADGFRDGFRAGVDSLN